MYYLFRIKLGCNFKDDVYAILPLEADTVLFRHQVFL